MRSKADNEWWEGAAVLLAVGWFVWWLGAPRGEGGDGRGRPGASKRRDGPPRDDGIDVDVDSPEVIETDEYRRRYGH